MLELEEYDMRTTGSLATFVSEQDTQPAPHEGPACVTSLGVWVGDVPNSLDQRNISLKSSYKPEQPRP